MSRYNKRNDRQEYNSDDVDVFEDMKSEVKGSSRHKNRYEMKKSRRRDKDAFWDNWN